MLEHKDIQEQATATIKWIDWYFQNLSKFPVKSLVSPKTIYDKIPITAPKTGDTIENLLKDLTDILLPGITHWQHPNFHAYFPANSSVESLCAEFVMAAMGAQCMVWETSPAAAELEERMMEWLRDLMGIPPMWEGCIQDTASTASLAAILTARERTTDFQSNDYGVPNNLRVYCSTQTHSSIEKAVGIAGMGRKNCIKIGVDEHLRMRPDLLEQQIVEDLQNGKVPCCVIAALGTTSTVAIDDIDIIGRICKKYGIWLHIDAAYAGSAFLLPEYQHYIQGIERADSFVFNPHKWLFTNFDCSVYFVKNVNLLLRTFEILPEYLKTKTRGRVNDYRDWGVPLGRRFRALKLWFVLRGMGINAIQERLRSHIALNSFFAAKIEAHPFFEMVLPPILNFSCIRLHPQGETELNTLNERFVHTLNQRGKVYVSHTKVQGQYVVRIVIGQTYIQQQHVENLLEELETVAGLLLKN